MIKINKNRISPPESLLPPYKEMFPENSIPKTAKMTHQCRKELIAKQAYTDTPRYNRRYKLLDIKNKLQQIYKSKCAYCEHRLEELHVERYRPKSIYFWLAYSWDNLLLACPTCNKRKGNHFQIRGPQIHFIETEQTLKDINNLSTAYDRSEKPLLVNPEKRDPKDHIAFSKQGEIFSDQEEFIYTIETCGLNRPALIDDRRKILNDFQVKIVSILATYKNPEQQQLALQVLFRSFKIDSQDEANEFIAFRKYCIIRGWLKKIVQQVRDTSSTSYEQK